MPVDLEFPSPVKLEESALTSWNPYLLAVQQVANVLLSPSQYEACCQQRWKAVYQWWPGIEFVTFGSRLSVSGWEGALDSTGCIDSSCLSWVGCKSL